MMSPYNMSPFCSPSSLLSFTQRTHEPGVFDCAWSPLGSLLTLATGVSFLGRIAFSCTKAIILPLSSASSSLVCRVSWILLAPSLLPNHDVSFFSKQKTHNNCCHLASHSSGLKPFSLKPWPWHASWIFLLHAKLHKNIYIYNNTSLVACPSSIVWSMAAGFQSS